MGVSTDTHADMEAFCGQLATGELTGPFAWQEPHEDQESEVEALSREFERQMRDILGDGGTELGFVGGSGSSTTTAEHLVEASHTTGTTPIPLPSGIGALGLALLLLFIGAVVTQRRRA